MTLKDEIAAAITPTIESTGAYLEEVQFVRAGKKSLLTVIIDSESGLNLDQVTEVSRSISEIVESLPAMGSTPFTLEVTSPGIDRPLTLPRHWRKNQNRLVRVVKNDGTVVEGRIANSSETSAIIGESEVNFADIKKALIQIEFKAAE
jgi:ribosome maturation factor RimP